MNFGTVLLLGLLVLVFLNVQSTRKARRARADLVQRLVPHAEVVTTSGVHATVTAVAEDGTCSLEVAPGVVMRWEQLAVGRIVTSPADADEPAAPVAPVEPAAAAEPGATSTETDDTATEALPHTAPPDRA